MEISACRAAEMKNAAGDFPVRVRFGRISEDWKIMQNQRHAVKLYFLWVQPNQIVAACCGGVAGLWVFQQLP
jgi:hypothetical protein